MQAIIKPGFLKGTVVVPPSKSLMQRACAGALLHKGRTIIRNPGVSEDDKAALHIIQQLGARVIFNSADRLTIESSGNISAAGEINCGESGLSARMFVPVAALSAHTMIINGKGSLLKRPMDVYENCFPQLGVSLEDYNGHIPFSVKGPLRPGNITIDGSLSSQFLTGLLYAYCYAATDSVIIDVQNLKSRPYIDLTLATLRTFGWHIVHENYERFIIDPAQFEREDVIDIAIEADWSSAAYWLVGAVINGAVALPDIAVSSLQADRHILDILSHAGAHVAARENCLSVQQGELTAFDMDLSDSPDLFPIVAILAAICKGKSKLRGVHRLKHKESDRETSIAAMLRQFGVSFQVESDALIIDGGSQLHGAVINGYNDHRIVMAAAVGALVADGTTVISDAGAVAKSYPSFFEHLRSLGVQCELKN